MKKQRQSREIADLVGLSGQLLDRDVAKFCTLVWIVPVSVCVFVSDPERMPHCGDHGIELRCHIESRVGRSTEAIGYVDVTCFASDSEHGFEGAVQVARAYHLDAIHQVELKLAVIDEEPTDDGHLPRKAVVYRKHGLPLRDEIWYAKLGKLSEGKSIYAKQE